MKAAASLCSAFLVSFSIGIPSVDAISCSTSVVSGSTTHWTHGESPLGVDQESEVHSSNLGWVSISASTGGPTPQFIWKEAASESPPTFTPVVFTRLFNHCDPLGGSGTLTVHADDNYRAFVNGVLVASCGPPHFLDTPGCHGTPTTASVTLLPADNTLVVLVWNQAAGIDPLEGSLGESNPAMLQYKLDF